MKTINTKILSGFREQLVLDERSAGTVEKYVREAREFAVWLDERELTRTNVLAWKQRLMESGLSPKTVNGKLSSLNALLRYMEREDCRVRTLKIQRQIFRPKERELTREEYEKLVSAANENKLERLSLILESLCCGGLRVSELRFITVETLENGEISVYQKGKCRSVMLPKRLVKKLKIYAAAHGISHGEVFLTKSGRSIGRKQIWAEMKALCRKTNVDPRKVFPHNLRHLFAVEYYRLHKDIVKLADILGHSNISTTRLYLISSGEEHLKQIEELHLVC